MISSEKILSALHFSLLGTIAVLPWSMRINAYLAIIDFALWIIYIILLKKIIFSDSKAFLIFTSIFLLELIGLVYSPDIPEGLTIIETTASLLLFPLIFSTIPRLDKQQFNLIIIVFFISCLSLFFFVILSNINFYELFHSDYISQFLYNLKNIFNENYIHPGYFSLFGIFSVFTIFKVWSTISSPNTKLLIVFFSLILFFLPTVTSSKSFIIAGFILLLAAPIFISKNIKAKMMVLAIGITSISIFIIYILIVPNRILQIFSNYINHITDQPVEEIYAYEDRNIISGLEAWKGTNRLIVWKNSIEVIGDNNLLIGIGTGGVQQNLVANYEKNKESWHIRYLNSHNQYLDFMLAYGFLGLILFIYLLYFSFKTALNRKDYYYFIFLFLFAFGCLTENLFARQWGVVFYSFFNALFYYQPFYKKET